MKKILCLFMILLVILSFTVVSNAGTLDPTDLGFMDYINSYNIPIIFVLYLIGFGLKKWEYLKDKYIPIVLVVIAWVTIFFYMVANESPDLSSWQTIGFFIITTLVQSVFVTGAAVLGNQIYKQVRKQE